ncbi:MAG: hypothetical protein ACYDBQ_07855 [Thermoplasmatota archaeon]
MPGLRGYWPLPDGAWAVVRDLDREDLAVLADSLAAWQERPTETSRSSRDFP